LPSYKAENTRQAIDPCGNPRLGRWICSDLTNSAVINPGKESRPKGKSRYGKPSTFAPKTQTVSAVCSEPDATLQVNGQVYQGRAQVEAKTNKAVSIMCTKPGYFPAQKTIDYSLSGPGVADAIGTVLFLLPGLGLFTAGAWKLDETDANLAMVKSEK
jgi:hypothetical protein